MEVVSAARWEALQNQTIAGLVGQKVFRHRLEEPVAGTGGHALVVWRDVGWATPPRVGRLAFPVIVFDCYADPSRDDLGHLVRMDAEDKAWALWRAVENRFHGVGDEWWGARGTNPGVRVVTCRRAAEPTLIGSDDLHMTGRAGDTATLGDTVLVRSRYAVEV